NNHISQLTHFYQMGTKFWFTDKMIVAQVHYNPDSPSLGFPGNKLIYRRKTFREDNLITFQDIFRHISDNGLSVKYLNLKSTVSQFFCRNQNPVSCTCQLGA